MTYPCDRFAALLAHSLNSERSTSLRIDPGALYAQLSEALAARYAEPLLHHPVYAWRMSEDEAAARYFNATLARRLMLSGKVAFSVSHKLFEMLCQRSTTPGWQDAALQRETAPDAPNTEPDDGDLAEIRQRLAELPDTLSSGSASPTLLARSGPVRLKLDAGSLPVAEELSLWDAICCAPRTLRALPAGEPFNRFCGLMIDGVRTANRPFQEALGLGRRLCPFDWMDTLSIHQMRGLRRFLETLDEHQLSDSPAHWEQAWNIAPVPGFKFAGQLWESEIGQALRLSSSQCFAALDDLAELADPDANTAQVLDEDEFLQQLELLEVDGVIAAAERRLLADLYRGAELSALAQRPDIKAQMLSRGLRFEALIADLQRRVEHWHSQQPLEMP